MTPSTTCISSRRTDRLLLVGLVLGAGIAAGVLLLIVIYVGHEAWPALRSIGPLRFFNDPAWQPTAGSYGLAPMLAGSLTAALLSTLVTLPLGLGLAIFLQCFAPPVLGPGCRRVVELLAGIPSVVYGFWGLVVLVPAIAAISPNGTGHSLLAGVCVLALMTLPIITLSADAALAQVPRAQWQAAASLGLSRWTTVRRVALPQALHGILTGGVLQVGRALGETMAVLMVCGNIVQTPDSLFAPIRTLTANIALEMGYATADHRSVLFVSGLVLLLIVVMLVAALHAAGGRGQHG